MSLQASKALSASLSAASAPETRSRAATIDGSSVNLLKMLRFFRDSEEDRRCLENKDPLRVVGEEELLREWLRKIDILVGMRDVSGERERD